jgi:hypothetical protein
MSLPTYGSFKFEVGEFVQSSYVNVQRDMKAKHIHKEVFQVVERLYQECPGGVQLHYLCRPQAMIFNGGQRDYVRLNEIELDKLDSRDVE